MPAPEWPLIIPCAAKKSLIFSRNMVTLLFSYEKVGTKVRSPGNGQRATTRTPRACTYLEPIGALLAKAKALEAETDTRLTTALCIRPFVAFLEGGDATMVSMYITGNGRQVTNLATDPASIAARLGAHRAFCFGRSGLLSLLLLWWSRGDGSPRGGGRIMHCSGRE